MVAFNASEQAKLSPESLCACGHPAIKHQTLGRRVLGACLVRGCFGCDK